MADIGYEGTYMPMVLNAGALNDLRKMAGPPPSIGKKWFMVNLATGECKWYQASKRRSYNKRRY